jgi:HEPN domain-containing protein
MPPRLFRLDDTKLWLRHAADDLEAAEFLSTDRRHVKTALYHCQQCAEKALKAFLVWHDRTFKKTHDLRTIGQQCVALDATLSPIAKRATELTKFAWTFRYPGEPAEPTPEEAQAKLALAREVYEAILHRVPEAAPDPPTSSP